MGLLENLNTMYPCTKRKGYGKECNCTNKPVKISESNVECEIFGHIAGSNCTDCNYQYQEQRRQGKA